MNQAVALLAILVIPYETIPLQVWYYTLKKSCNLTMFYLERQIRCFPRVLVLEMLFMAMPE